MNLKRRNIVITGGTRGIGRELVRMLYQDNNVIVIARDPQRLTKLTDNYPGVTAVCADLADLPAVEAAAAEVLSQVDKLDLLINNAAVQYTPTFIDADFEYASIEREITVNFTSMCALTSLLLPSLMHDGDAAIVNVNSGLGLVPKTNSAVYCATKAAVNNFSQSLRYQLARTKVRVMQAFVPLVDTQMTAGRGDGKLSPGEAASAMLRGIELDIEENDIGKIRALRKLIRFAPGIARRIMKAA